MFEVAKFIRKYNGLGDKKIAPSESFTIALLVELAEALDKDIRYLNDYKNNADCYFCGSIDTEEL